VNIQTAPLSFIEVTILVVILGSFLLLLLFNSKIKLKLKHAEVFVNNKNNTKNNFTGSPHANCPHRYSIIDIFGHINAELKDFYRLSFLKLPTKQVDEVRQQLDIYYLQVVNIYLERLIFHKVKNPVESHDYKYFKLIFKDIVKKAALIFKNIIVINGFMNFVEDRDKFKEYKESVYKRVSITLASQLDEYYVGDFIVGRDELSIIDDPDNMLKNTINSVLNKLLEITIHFEREKKKIKNNITDFTLGVYKIDVFKTLDENILLNEEGQND